MSRQHETPNGEGYANIHAGSPKSDVSAKSDMLDAKITRKRAEADLQLLANRIALLKVEETRALNKVSETKLRAQEILQYVLVVNA